ncbi:FIG00456945: hypothetical protein [Caballeronia glathei]|jgi:uncharacterized protein YbjQ (UPF0145 family)|uniref:Signal peptidase n=1 Tax=Caballeronia glathei TaxID=60547 RepID=A0A069PLD2_9BURK|nr:MULTISPECIES: hypothetical protein [Burkholderiaceae]KDR38106.1 signal peptidase [Caballeronia glathei]TCK35311.1 hypothetical protein B0G84_7301 [Paraburkholderia sp. BL8N3]CDY73452.1 FIG00456945: hypothetical protein [Caballeronia glathei]
MKNRFVMLGMVAGIVMSQAACTTQIRSLPMPADVQTQNKQGVPLYFGDESHPDVRKLIETKEVRARVAREMTGQDATCNIALGKALQQLRDYAAAQHGNAVVNVTTRFQRTETSSSKEYTCGSSNNGSTLAVRGDVVLLDAQ